MITGTIKDSKTGDTLPNATILVINPATGAQVAGTISNVNGQYQVQGTIMATLKASYTGYTAKTRTITSINQKMDFDLEPGVNLQEVEITASRINWKLWIPIILCTVILTGIFIYKKIAK